jgi:antitoxin YefM
MSTVEITTYSIFRQNLKSFMDSVFETSSPLYVKRAKGEDIVVMSKSDYESLTETLYLLNNPKNAARLAQGLDEYNRGMGEVKQLIEE